MTPSKNSIVQTLLSLVEQKISSLEKQLLSLDESAEDETKSSAGDKYETSIEMLKQEQEKLSKQLHLQIVMKRQLTEIRMGKMSQVGLGSIVVTSELTFFIAVPIGKAQIEHNEIMCISPAAPIAQAMHGAKQGDVISFQAKTLTILEVI
jgi:transcription elongation GreA/GreB family factor